MGLPDGSRADQRTSQGLPYILVSVIAKNRQDPLDPEQLLPFQCWDWLPRPKAEVRNGSSGGYTSTVLEVIVAAGCCSDRDCQHRAEHHTRAIILHN